MLVIGLDGATWNLLKPLIDAGELPTIKQLIKNGLCDKLESSIPPVTVPAWKCYSTGTNPAKLGVYTWVGLDIKNKKSNVYNSKLFKGDDLWDYLGRKEYKVGVINMPGTYPPKPVNGFMISGLPANEPDEYTYPQSLKKELVKNYDYKLHPSTMLKIDVTNEKITLDEIKELIKLRFKIAKKYINTVDFFHLTIFYIDIVQHFMWKYMENGGEHKNAIRDAWKIIDQEMGDLISCIDKDCNIFLMSDHGFTKQVVTFYINSWFEQEGYLAKRQHKIKMNFIPSLAHSLGINRNQLVHIAETFGIKQILMKIIPINVALKIPDKKGKVGIGGIFDVIDWDKTKVIAIGEGLVYINKDNLTDTEYKALRIELVEKLKEIKHPKTNTKIIQDAYLKEDIYNGEFLDDAPDIVVLWNEGYEIRGYLMDGKMWDYDTEWSAHHKRHGIFVAHGPDIRNDVDLEGTTIYDLAPTILHMFDVPIPKKMDGKVLKNIFHPDSELARRDVAYENQDYNKQLLKNKIGNLKKRGNFN